MKMKIENGELIIIEADATQYSIIKSWSMMRWDRRRKWIIGPATAELLNRLAKFVGLPKPIEAERQRMNRVQEAVDAERLKEKPSEFYKYPVKLPLFSYQQKGVNMALLTFGLIEPPSKGETNEVCN